MGGVRMTFKTAAQVKRIQLLKAKDKLTEIRSSAYLWNNLPEAALVQVEAACEAMSRAILAFDEEGRRRGWIL
jgi:hypothetical protein